MASARFEHLLAGTAIAVALALTPYASSARAASDAEITAAVPMPESAEDGVMIWGDGARLEAARSILARPLRIGDDAAVLRLAFEIGAIADQSVAAIALGLYAFWRNPLRDEIGLHRLGALRGKLELRRLRTRIVGKALKLHLPLRIV